MGAGREIYSHLRLSIDHTVDYLFALYFNSKKKTIPKPKNNLVLKSATTLGRKIRFAEVTSTAVVEAFIDRIKEVNPMLNAVVDTRFDEALREAKQIDEDLRNGKITKDDFKKKPFLGVPFTAKESIMCKGLKSTYGLPSRKNNCQVEDATVIKLMKEAGGILMGVTNVPQLNRWTETYNPLYGVTNNPYDTTRNVGGSTGGEASIIAARGSPIGIGTDIGGSIRIPAYRCGIFAHKLTPDIICSYGLTINKTKKRETILSTGLMSAYSKDLLPLLKVLTCDDNTSKLYLDQRVNVKKIKIFYMTESSCLRSSPVPSTTKELILKCVEYFKSISRCKPEEVNFENARHSLSLWTLMMQKEEDKHAKQSVNYKSKMSALREITKYVFRQSEFNLYTMMNIFNEAIMPKPNEERFGKILKDLKDEIVGKLGNNGVLLFPSEPYAAGYHYSSILRPYNFSYYALWSALKFPVTQVPLGLNEERLPVGIQVVAAPLQDRLTISVAKELERKFGGYIPPFDIQE